MPSEATARRETAAVGPSPRSLEFYRTRDDMMRAYAPSTDEERLLVSQIARAWQHLQQMYELETKLLETHNLLDLFTNDLDRYKLLTRGIAEAERMWRYAVQEFQRARRRRESRDPAPVRSSARRNPLTPTDPVVSRVTSAPASENSGNLGRVSERHQISATEPPPQAKTPRAGNGHP